VAPTDGSVGLADSAPLQVESLYKRSGKARWSRRHPPLLLTVVFEKGHERSGVVMLAYFAYVWMDGRLKRASSTQIHCINSAERFGSHFL